MAKYHIVRNLTSALFSIHTFNKLLLIRIMHINLPFFFILQCTKYRQIRRKCFGVCVFATSQTQRVNNSGLRHPSKNTEGNSDPWLPQIICDYGSRSFSSCFGRGAEI